MLEKDFSCNKNSFNGEFEKVTDVKKNFSISLPKYWKTNFFYDKLQSSIYTADTTKQLTETVLIDITHVKSHYQFNDNFKNMLAQNDNSQSLTNTKQQKFVYKNHDAFYTLSKGKKSNFTYQILNIFIKQNQTNSYHFKTEVYGKSLVNERFCKAIKTLNTLSFYESK